MAPLLGIQKLLSQRVGTKVFSKTQRFIGFPGFCPFVLLSLGGCINSSQYKETPTLQGHKDIRGFKGLKVSFSQGKQQKLLSRTKVGQKDKR